MKKVLTVSLILFLLVLVAIVMMVNSFGGKLIQKVVNVSGPAALGVPVSLEKADFHLLRGNVFLKGLKVGNPEGFKTDNLFEFDSLEVDLDPRALLAGEVHIRKIIVDAPKITYERGLTASNLSDLLDRLEEKSGAADKPAEEVETEAKPTEEPATESSTKVVIDELAITGARLKVSLTVAQGFSVPVPLPPIILKDIGKDSHGITFMEVIRMVLRAIIGSVTGVLKGSAALVGDGAALVGDGVMAVGGVGVDGVKAVGKGAAVVGGAAVDGAAAVGGAAADGAKAVGGAVVGGASAVADGIGGLFKNDKKDEAKEE